MTAHPVFVVLPVTAFFLWALLLSRPVEAWRRTFLKGSVAMGLSLVLITEGLSLFGLLAGAAIAGSWLLVDLLLLAILWYRHGLQDFDNRWQFPGGQALLFWLGTGVLAFLAWVTALAAPPNNFDSMSYHLPRVMHWLQQGSVAHYPTPFTPQLYQPPWAEYAILHLQALTGMDMFDNFVQWSSLIGAAIAASFLVASLGGGPMAQAFAALALVSLPMALLQASTTQNDVAVAFWIICFACFTIDDDRSAGAWFFQGASLGLALLCKGTAVFFAGPFCLWLAFRRVAQGRKGILEGLAIVGIVLAVNAPLLYRNISLSGHAYGTFTDAISRRFDVSAFISTVLKNAVTQLNTPWLAFNSGVYHGIAVVHGWLGLSAQDPAINRVDFKLGDYGVMIAHFRHEDVVGNFWQFILFPLALLAVRPGKARYYALATAAGFLAFSLMVRWQPWNSRLLVPFFVLGAPCLGLAMECIPSTFLRMSLALLLFFVALDAQVFCWSRPLAGPGNLFQSDKISLYFRNAATLEDEARKVASMIRHDQPVDLGLDFNGIPMEYPLWALIKDLPTDSPRFINVNVPNESVDLAPCAAPEELLMVDWDNFPMQRQICGWDYQKLWAGEKYGLYKRQARLPTNVGSGH